MNDLTGVNPDEWVAAAKELNDRVGHTVLERDITDFDGEAPIWVERHFEEDEDTRAISYIEAGTALPASGRWVDVTVWAPRRRYGADTPATVNWPGIGSVEAVDAGRFAALLRYAAGTAVTAW